MCVCQGVCACAFVCVSVRVFVCMCVCARACLHMRITYVFEYTLEGYREKQKRRDDWCYPQRSCMQSEVVACIFLLFLVLFFCVFGNTDVYLSQEQHDVLKWQWCENVSEK